MMREIKFRAWDKAEKIMLADVGMNEMYINDIFNDGAYVFMQYTGLQDKDGKDIYEGDIIKCIRNCITKDGEVIHTVGFYNGCFGAEGGSPLWNLVDSFRPEIIGNIYEHPHLKHGLSVT